MKTSFRFEGGEELSKALGQLSTRLSKQILREALTLGAQPIRKTARSIAPREPGAPDMADHIETMTARTQEQAAVAVGPTKEYFYGFFQEVGTAHHGAQPFMRPAFEQNVQKALGIVGQELWRALASRGFHRSATVDGGLTDSAFADTGAGLGAGNFQTVNGKRLR